MHAANCHEMALGIVLLTQHRPSDDALSRKVRDWFAQPTGRLRDVLAAHGSWTQAEVAAAEQLVTRWLELGDSPSAAGADTPSKANPSEASEEPIWPKPCWPKQSLPEPSLPLFDDRSDEDEQVRSIPNGGASLPPATRYRIVRRHAGGGLGEIFLAHDEELGRDVALKRIREEYVAHSDLRARFMLEAEITGLVEHPGVVPVYGRGHDAQGCPFYAMRFIQGKTLQQAIEDYHQARSQPGGSRDAALELRRLLRHFVDVCNAVACVHHRGVIHRDLKPENVMIGPYGETFVLDWGLAKIIGRSERDADTEGSESTSDALNETLRPLSAESPIATQIGSAIGTLAYMSPEQAAGLVDQLRPTSDLYALGAILYAILTGQPPMQGADCEQIRQNVLMHRFPRPRDIWSGTPMPLEAVCLKAMTLDPQQRYHSATEIAKEIEAWMADEPVRAWREPWQIRAARWVRRNRVPVVGAAAALCVATISLAIGTILLAQANRKVRQSESIAVQREEDARWNFQLARNAVDRYLTQISEDDRLKAEDLEPLRRDLLQTAQAFYEQFVRQQPDDPELRAAWGWAHYRLASITSEIGSKQEAISLQRTAVSTFTQLAAQFPDNISHQEGRIRALIELARLQLETGDAQSAVGELNSARDLCVALQKARPELPVFSEALADCLDQFAQLGRVNANSPETETALLAAIDLRRQLVADAPENASIRSALAGNLATLGAHYCQHRRFPDSATCLSEAATLQQRLVDEHRHSATYLSALATTCDTLVSLYNEWSATPGQTETAMLAALRIRQRLTREHPAVTEYQASLAASQHALAKFYTAADRLPDAEDYLRMALQCYEPLVETHADVPEYSLALAAIHRDLATALARRDLVNESLPHRQEAVRILRALGDRFPKQAQYPQQLARDCCQWGAAEVAAQHPEDAEKAYSAAIDAMELAVSLSQILTVADDAQWLAAQPDCNGPTAFRTAVLLSLAAEAVANDTSVDAAERDRHTTGYAESAFQALQTAAAEGYFTDPVHVTQLRERDAFRFLRSHSELGKKLEALIAPPKQSP